MGSWRDRAACRGLPTDPWFDCVEDPETGEREVDDAGLALCRRTCAVCPVRVECFTEVMAEEGNAIEERRHGVWAGTTPEQRASLYRRFAVACPECREVFDPAASINGLLVCECGEQVMWSVDDRGDQWLDRHSSLAARVGRWLQDYTEPGERVPSPTALARTLVVRKDDVIRVYRAAVRDGMLRAGPGRGVYYRV